MLRFGWRKETRVCAVLLLGAAAIGANAQALTTLATFNGTNSGMPNSLLQEKRQGELGERRFHYRAPRSEKVEIQWIDTTGQSVKMVGDLVVLSQSGSRLHTGQSIPVKTSGSS